MKNAKQYTLLALGAFVGFNVANNVQASTNDTQERQYGHGYYGHPHEQPGHPLYKPQISTERTQKMRMPRGYGQPTQQPEISEVVSEQLPDYEKATEQSVDVQPSAPEMPSTTAD